MNRSSVVSGAVSWIVDASIWSVRLIKITIFGLSALQCVRAEPPQAETKQPNPSDTRVVEVRVIDPSNQPIENANFAAMIARKGVDYASMEDARIKPESHGKGVFRIAVPMDAEYVQLQASAAGRVPMTASWGGDEIDSQLLGEFAFTLPPGTKASGHVVNEQGQPIADAEVYLLVVTDKSTRQQVDLHQHLVKTDRAGVWVCDVMPAKFNDIWIRLAHPDYASDNMFGETAGQVSIDDLRSGKHSMTMKAGIAVSGKVVDKSEQSVAGAIVYQGSDRFGSSYPETKTNSVGEFSFPRSKAGEMVLTIVAKGFAPELRVVQIDPQTPPINIELQPGNKLRIRTVGAEGKPLAGVMVAPDTWRGRRSLADIDMPRRSDADGWFVWDDAPVDEIAYSVLLQGWMDQRDLLLKPQADEIVVNMLRPLNVSGTVTDAQTGVPISKFTLVPGIKWEQGERITWQRNQSTNGSDGRYTLKFSFPRPAHLIQIEATGYEPLQSRPIKSDEGDLTLDFQLKPAKQLIGTVVSPDGTPAASADVVVTLPNLYVNIFNGRMHDERDQPFVVADDKGQFTLASQKDAFKLIFLHDSGAAMIDGTAFTTGQTVKLVPWAKIKGTVKIGNQPAAQTALHLFHSDPTSFSEPRFTMGGRALADANGEFEFDRVFPNADFQVSRIIPLAERGESYTHATEVKTVPGETAVIAIGGTGRPVVGRAIVTNVAPKYVWANAMLSASPEAFDKPADYDEWSKEQQSKWFNDWSKTDDGQTYVAQFNRRYTVNPNADGSFRVEDVPTGRYNLSLAITAALDNKQCGFGEKLGSVQQFVTVPEMEGGRSDEPLLLGDVTVRLRNFLLVGDKAPPLTATTLDGESIDLANLRGKYVLVDFWATWCGPCLAEFPNFEKAYERCGDRDDFVLLSLSLDADLADAKAYIAKNPHGWLQGHIAVEQISDIQNEYGFLAIPATFLIGPDGKILAKDLRGPDLPNQLEDLLP